MKLIQSLLEMAKRASPDGFYKLGKEMYGAEKVKSLSWSEIKAIADKHDVLIPAYLRSQKVGRGRFNIVPADHADAKSSKLSLPVSPREIARAKDELRAAEPTASDAVLQRALNSVYVNMRSEKENRYADWREVPEKAHGGFSIETRYWGHWETPQDVEDDEDYDWQELSSDSRKKLRDIIDRVSKNYPDVKLSYDIGEKNWITIFAKAVK